jgi:hypothetical protein
MCYIYRGPLLRPGPVTARAGGPQCYSDEVDDECLVTTLVPSQGAIGTHYLHAINILHREWGCGAWDRVCVLISSETWGKRGCHERNGGDYSRGTEFGDRSGPMKLRHAPSGSLRHIPGKYKKQEQYEGATSQMWMTRSRGRARQGRQWISLAGHETFGKKSR